MKLKNNFFFTLREDVKDEDSRSGNLLVKAGMIKKAGAGIYTYLPLGMKTMKNIEDIVRDEMNKADALELVMPSLLPEEVYVASGRREIFGNDMFGLKDRYNREYVLGPTHEEMFVNIAKDGIKSYKDMPVNLYQIATKYRDEPRPRYGLIRIREFTMKDAYSFDKDEEGLDISYNKMFNAYKNIFDRIGIDYKIVTASTGAMGGLLSEEFQAVTEIGEDVLVICDECGYSSNIEVSKCVSEFKEQIDELKEKELLHTPNVGTIDDLVNNYNIAIDKMVKTLIYDCDGKLYACLVKGDREVNEWKVSKITESKKSVLASFENVEEITKAKVGFAGPVDLNIPIIVDEEVMLMKNFLVGANKSDYHYINTNIKDINIYKVADIKNVKENDLCPTCGKNLKFKKGIEVGNTFKLGTKYSKALGLNYLDEFNQLKPVVMGCYGIGIGRILASIIEQNNDEKGIIFPMSIAPFKVAIVVVDTKNEEQMNLANNLYNQLKENNIEVLLDDRDERVGVKFNDMDLIGIPLRITIGKKLSDNLVELKERKESTSKDIEIEKILNSIKELIK
ncbi:MAG: proline--tRNA ligase [Bacilli bacterium]|nr:proline--tRNA ligase [Bacilli bacterium]